MAEPAATPNPAMSAAAAPAPGFSTLPQSANGPGGFREARAYRLVLDSGACTLEAVEEIRGDFRRPRAVAWAAGMLSCRLLDATGRVLAEETMPAPDHLCVVLDPLTPGPDGRPAPAALTPSGPVTFQTRLPKFSTAASLEIIRLSGEPAPSAGARPPGQLLASIPLASR